MASDMLLSGVSTTIQENDDVRQLRRRQQKEGPPGRMQHDGATLRYKPQHFGSFVMQLSHHKDERQAKRLTMADLAEKKKLNALEQPFEKIKKRQRAKEEDMEFQQKRSQRPAKAQANFTNQWKVRNPAVLDADVASASALPLADQGGASAVATQPASPASSPTRQATRQAPKEQGSSLPRC